MEIVAGELPKYQNLWLGNNVNDPWENLSVLVSSVVEKYWSSEASVISQCWHLHNRDIDSLWLEMQSPSNFFCQQESYNELGALDQILVSVSNSASAEITKKHLYMHKVTESGFTEKRIWKGIQDLTTVQFETILGQSRALETLNETFVN